MRLKDEDPAIKMKLDYDPDKNQQKVILKYDMDNNATKQAGCQLKMV